MECSNPYSESDVDPYYYDIEVDQEPGMVDITVVNVGNLDSMGIIGSNGTKSTQIEISEGDRFTLRSNEEVINHLKNCGITVLTSSGTKTVENAGELPSEYREAPAGFVNPEANISNYDNASIATVACLYESANEFELGGRHIPAGVSIPCNTPILAQEIDDKEVLGTHMKPTSGPNKNETLVSPVTLKEGEYHLIGIIEGQKKLVQSVRVTDAQRKNNNTVTEGEE
jgi:hypothetical protein